MKIVSLGKTAVPVTEEEIESIKMVTRSGLPADPWPFPAVGEKVVIRRGPLCGLEGTVTDVAGAQRLVVSVTLLQRSIAVDIDRGWTNCITSVTCRGPQLQAA